MHIKPTFITKPITFFINHQQIDDLPKIGKPKNLRRDPIITIDDISLEISNQALERIYKNTCIQIDRLRRKKRKEVYYNTPDTKQKNVEQSLPKGYFILVGDLNLTNTKYADTADINTIYGNLLIGQNESLKDISSIKTIYGNICVEANSREEAIELLNKLNFQPQKVLGELIIIEKIKEGQDENKHDNSISI